jgi:predicted transcriptional regulator of viral defense system
MIAPANQQKASFGIELVRLLAQEGDRVFTAGRARELGPRVGLKESYLHEALHHLHRQGWIVPLRRGLYALSSLAPGVTPVHEFEVAMVAARPAAISHWSAMHYLGLSDQIPRTVFVLVPAGTSIPQQRGGTATHGSAGCRIGATLYRFVRVKPERFFGFEKVWVGEARITITDPERTLLDGLARPQYCGDFAEVLHAFQARSERLDLQRILDYALRLDGATAKRLGWILEQAGIDPARLEVLAKMPVKGYRTLDPTGPRSGPRNRRWMIQENLPGRAGA